MKRGKIAKMRGALFTQQRGTMPCKRGKGGAMREACSRAMRAAQCRASKIDYRAAARAFAASCAYVPQATMPDLVSALILFHSFFATPSDAERCR